MFSPMMIIDVMMPALNILTLSNPDIRSFWVISNDSRPAAAGSDLIINVTKTPIVLPDARREPKCRHTTFLSSPFFQPSVTQPSFIIAVIQ